MKLDEKFIRRAAIEWLSKRGYDRRLREKETMEHGVDIKVRHNRYPRYYLVEVKGDANERTVKHIHSRREVSFIYVLGQIMSRMKYKAKYKYAIALPYTFEKKILTRLPWLLCKKLNLNVLLVGINSKVNNITWRELKRYQK